MGRNRKDMEKKHMDNTEGYVDLHAHILPGVDDGAKDIAGTRQMLQMAYEEGIRMIVATPHHRRGYAYASVGVLREAYEKTCAEAAEISPQIKVCLGSELHKSHALIEELSCGTALSMAGTSYVLVEFLPTDSYGEIRTALQRLQMAGWRPVIAHAERYACLVRDIEKVEELTDLGCRVQINTGSVTGANGIAAKRFTKKLLKYGLVHFLGTDAHDMGSRAPQMKKCISYIEKKYGEDYANQIGRENALRLLADKPI